MKLRLWNSKKHKKSGAAAKDNELREIEISRIQEENSELLIPIVHGIMQGAAAVAGNAEDITVVIVPSTGKLAGKEVSLDQMVDIDQSHIPHEMCL